MQGPHREWLTLGGEGGGFASQDRFKPLMWINHTYSLNFQSLYHMAVDQDSEHFKAHLFFLSSLKYDYSLKKMQNYK